MNKLKLVFNFLKIKLKNIGSVLLKGSTAYMIGAFGLIQVASIVADNINIAESLGVTKEIFMQYLFLGVIFLFPVFLIVTFLSCLLYTSPSPRDGRISRMPSSA